MPASPTLEPVVERILLPAWDQCAIRAYIQLAFCFPFSSNSTDASHNSNDKSDVKTKAEAHLRAALHRLAQQRPEFPAKLRADKQGRVWLERQQQQQQRGAEDATAATNIPFEVVSIAKITTLHQTHTSTSTAYTELKRKGFPPGAFLHPDLAIDGALVPGGEAQPVIRIQLTFFDEVDHGAGGGGGMVLWVNAHHSLIDGEGARLLVQCFAAQTRGVEKECPGALAPAAMQRLEEGGGGGVQDDTKVDDDGAQGRRSTGINAPADTNEAQAEDFTELVRRFAEYADLPERNGPNAVPLSFESHGDGGRAQRVERIFVFQKEAIKHLGLGIAAAPDWKAYCESGRPLSSYLSLAALMWAHITMARVRAFEKSEGRTIDRQSPAKLTTAVDWRKRAFQGTLVDYLGIAVAIPFTQLPLGVVLDAARPSPDGTVPSIDRLARLACQVQQTIDSVNEEFVMARTKLMTAYKNDPRRFGLGIDPTDPTCLGFNTWRFLSSDAEWSIPGVNTSRPDAVRRVGAKIGVEKALILPMGSTEGGQEGNIEMLIWLTEDAMELLLRDEGFMRWVDHVIE